MKTVLHVGCGPKANRLPREYESYRELRVDVDPAVEPTFITSIVAMPVIESEVASVVFASHILEHLYAHEVAMALAEFHRVLVPGGFADIRVPDLQSIGGKLGMDQLGDGLYQNGTFGLVTPLDLIYGHRGHVANGNLFMAHKTGFTKSVMKKALGLAGFAKVEFDLTTPFELKAIAWKRSDSIFGVGGVAEGERNAVQPKLVG